MKDFKVRNSRKILFVIMINFILMNNLSAQREAHSNNVPLEIVYLSETYLIDTANETIENKHFICSTPYFSAIKVSTTNTLIRGNLFENCVIGVELHKAYNTTIKGNRFNNMGAGVASTYIDENSRIEYNEFLNLGVLNCQGATHGGNCQVYAASASTRNGTFSHNLVDNRGANARYMEDYIALYSGDREYEQNMVVEDNLLIGSEVSSATGSCFVADGKGSGYTFRGNRCYNVSGYGMGIASAKNALVENNLIYMDEAHVKAITYFNSNTKHDGSYTFAVTDYYRDICASNVTFLNNKGYNYLQDKSAPFKNIGYAWGCLVQNRANIHQLVNFHQIEGYYAHNIQLYGNQFYSEDPHWEIPSNIFEGLDHKYFSGNNH